jgi:transposase
MEKENLAQPQKKARQQGRTIVLIDESGLSQRPHRCRTWAPRGQTPILFHHFNWQSLSLIAGLTVWNFYFELFTETIKSPHIVLFLEHLQRAIPGKLLVIWDGLSAHRTQFVRDYIAGLNGHILTERLPAYAPELNPVEYIWAHLKQQELPNVCAKDLWHLGDRARHHLKRMRRRPKLIRAFWKQSSLVF